MATVKPSNVKNILRGIEQICLGVAPTEGQAPSQWYGSKIYSAPTAEQINAVGTPYLAVNRPRLVGYAVGGELVSMDMARGVQSTEPVWDFDVYSFHPYDMANPNYDDATDDMNNLSRELFDNSTLPYTAKIIGSTTNTITVDSGLGVRYTTDEMVYINGTQAEGPVQSISGDILTLYNPLTIQVNPGDTASQSTCYNSYPHSQMPDYAETVDKTGWCVGTFTVRAFEQLLYEYP